MKKLAKGISNYEELVTEEYYYVDKTKYIEKLENLADKRMMLLRPRKFGKTLFTSTLSYYYDINETEKFEKLFKETYIGKNPTKLRNSYHILKFNFSGIDTSSNEKTIAGFRREVYTSTKLFAARYGLDVHEIENKEAEDILDTLFKIFKTQRPEDKIYVIIDEYDHFANELLGFRTEEFKKLMSRDGKIRKWYEILKKGTETVVDRIFITGVTPIAVDSMTSGFNVSKDMTRDCEFNEMLGFTEEELIEVMNSQNMSEELKKSLLPIMREHYDGYKFSVDAEKKIYNSNMCLNFLDDYIRAGKMPRRMLDTNIASDYKKLANMLNLCQGEQREEIIEKAVAGEDIINEITEKFDSEKEYDDTDMISMLFYLGYLTIGGEKLGKTSLKIPNKVMKELYSDYFMKILQQKTGIHSPVNDYNQMLIEISEEGKIDKMISVMGEYLHKLSNRDAMRFDEKYVKIIFFSLAMNLRSMYEIKSEPEIQRKYPDILILPRERDKGYKSIMVEFKYLKKEEAVKLEEKQKEAREQIKQYVESDEIKNIEGMNCYTIVAINDELYVEKID